MNVNNQPDPAVTRWLTMLDDDHKKANLIDLLSVNELPGTEVPAWLA